MLAGEGQCEVARSGLSARLQVMQCVCVCVCVYVCVHVHYNFYIPMNGTRIYVVICMYMCAYSACVHTYICVYVFLSAIFPS